MASSSSSLNLVYLLSLALHCPRRPADESGAAPVCVPSATPGAVSLPASPNLVERSTDPVPTFCPTHPAGRQGAPVAADFSDPFRSIRPSQLETWDSLSSSPNLAFDRHNCQAHTLHPALSAPQHSSEGRTWPGVHTNRYTHCQGLAKHSTRR